LSFDVAVVRICNVDLATVKREEGIGTLALVRFFFYWPFQENPGEIDFAPIFAISLFVLSATAGP
jgi:hypothetical protein